MQNRPPRHQLDNNGTKSNKTVITNLTAPNPVKSLIIGGISVQF